MNTATAATLLSSSSSSSSSSLVEQMTGEEEGNDDDVGDGVQSPEKYKVIVQHLVQYATALASIAARPPIDTVAECEDEGGRGEGCGRTGGGNSSGGVGGRGAKITAGEVDDDINDEKESGGEGASCLRPSYDETLQHLGHLEEALLRFFPPPPSSSLSSHRHHQTERSYLMSTLNDLKQHILFSSQQQQRHRHQGGGVVKKNEQQHADVTPLAAAAISLYSYPYGATSSSTSSSFSSSATTSISTASTRVKFEPSPHLLDGVDTSETIEEDDVEGVAPSGRKDDNRKVKRLNKSCTTYLTSWLLQHLDCPFPSLDEKAHMATALGLSPAQVGNWMTNMRKRHVYPVLTGKKKPKSVLEMAILKRHTMGSQAGGGISSSFHPLLPLGAQRSGHKQYSDGIGDDEAHDEGREGFNLHDPSPGLMTSHSNSFNSISSGSDGSSNSVTAINMTGFGEKRYRTWRYCEGEEGDNSQAGVSSSARRGLDFFEGGDTKRSRGLSSNTNVMSNDEGRYFAYPHIMAPEGWAMPGTNEAGVEGEQKKRALRPLDMQQQTAQQEVRRIFERDVECNAQQQSDTNAFDSDSCFNGRGYAYVTPEEDEAFRQLCATWTFVNSDGERDDHYSKGIRGPLPFGEDDETSSPLPTQRTAAAFCPLEDISQQETI